MNSLDDVGIEKNLNNINNLHTYVRLFYFFTYNKKCTSSKIISSSKIQKFLNNSFFSSISVVLFIILFPISNKKPTNLFDWIEKKKFVHRMMICNVANEIRKYMLISLFSIVYIQKIFKSIITSRSFNFKESM